MSCQGEGGTNASREMVVVVDAVRLEGVHRSVVRRLASVIRRWNPRRQQSFVTLPGPARALKASSKKLTRPTRVDAPKLPLVLRLLREVLEDALGHGRPADVAEAHEQH